MAQPRRSSSQRPSLRELYLREGTVFTPRGSKCDSFCNVSIELEAGREIEIEKEDLQTIQWTRADETGLGACVCKLPKWLEVLKHVQVGDKLLKIEDVDVRELRLDAIMFQFKEVLRCSTAGLFVRLCVASSFSISCINLAPEEAGSCHSSIIVQCVEDDAPENLKQQLQKGDCLVSINDTDVSELRWDAIQFALKEATKPGNGNLLLRFQRVNGSVARSTASWNRPTGAAYEEDRESGMKVQLETWNPDNDEWSEANCVTVDLQTGRQDIFCINWRATKKQRGHGIRVAGLQDSAPEYFKQQLQKGDSLIEINGLDVRELRWDAIEFEFQEAIDPSNKTMVLRFAAERFGGTSLTPRRRSK